ncbi:MAG TPA: hypothetical protein DHW61_18265 [Lachnoclostridium phytofermentans]|uniref:Uncharacterized protein n=1 Tax=Lachnoclostridium phytofermentans TaxID=66219 RepID=A0A3D2XCT1_9FIRM|nr:hypothetical protein [Lachnoclostridium sp.]HCL04325.1 hypothetical protein [Lachnoclostridium phytofermentans]
MLKDNGDFHWLPDVVCNNINGIVTKEIRYEYQYPLIMKYLKMKIAGYSVGDFTRKINVNRIALYAITEFTDLFIDDLKTYDEQLVVTVADKKADKYPNGYKKYDVIFPQELYRLYEQKQIDCILVCSIFHENEVIKELLKIGFDINDLITVGTAISYMS